jgi:hypothetical protein
MIFNLADGSRLKRKTIVSILEGQQNSSQLTYSSDVRALYEHGPRSQGDQLEAGPRRIVPLATGHA